MKEPWQMTKEEFRNWEFPVPPGGSSKTPKMVFNWRRDEYETLADLANYDDDRLNEVLGKGWAHSTGIMNSLYLIPYIKQGKLITVYRASDVGDIIPGSYVSESQKYVSEHGEFNIPGGKYIIYSKHVYPDELMTYGDPHEFIYIPRNLERAHLPFIINALREGKNVPRKVLDEYPDLTTNFKEFAENWR
jgi:hypothetical protein